MALVKTTVSVDDWTAVAQNVVVEGLTKDLSTYYQAVLTIIVALTSQTAATNGCEVRVQISANSTGDEDWVDLTSLQGAIGTGNSENITNNPLAAGSTTITCASTTGYTLPTGTDNGWRYIKDATIINSEIILQNAVTANTSIGIVDGTTNSHVLNTTMYNIVVPLVVQLPDSANRVRVIYNNTKDSAGSTCDVLARISAITTI